MSGLVGLVGSKSGVIGSFASPALIDGSSLVVAGSSVTVDVSSSGHGLFKNPITNQVLFRAQLSGFPTATSQKLCDIPAGYRPYMSIHMPFINTNWSSLYFCRVNTDGQVNLWSGDYVGTARSATTQGILIWGEWFTDPNTYANE